MSVIYVLITVSLLIAVVFFIAFISAVRKGQYDDSVTPSIRMLFDNTSKKTNNNSKPIEKS